MLISLGLWKIVSTKQTYLCFLTELQVWLIKITVLMAQALLPAGTGLAPRDVLIKEWKRNTINTALKVSWVLGLCCREEVSTAPQGPVLGLCSLTPQP